MPISTNLVSYWQWESGLTDTMGTYNGTIGGAGSLSYVASMTGFGQCMDLTPSKYVTFGTVSEYGSGSFSISCWFNSDVATSGAYYTILGQSDGSYLGFNLFTDTGHGGRIRFEIGTDGVNWRSIWSTNAPSTSTWYHLVVVVDRSTNSAQMYIDGVLQSYASDTGAAVGSLSVVGTIGTKLNYWCAADIVGWNQWDGKIDDCAIWDRALTSAEALQIYNAGAAGNPLSTLVFTTSKLQGLWSSVVHAGPKVSRVNSLWSSVVHDGPPSPTAVCADITGTVGSIATFDGSSSLSPEFFKWSWVSVPGGSAVSNSSTPFPDGGATTPINMTDNEGLWHFEGNADDSSGNSRNGTVSGASQVTGKVGANAYQFGSSDYIDFGAASAFISSDFSISFWIKGDAAWTPAIYDSIVGASNFFAWSQGFGMFWQNSTTIRCFVNGYNVAFSDITVSSVTDWNHVVMTFDGSTLTAFLNGASVSQVSHSGALTGLANNFQASRLGTHSGGEQTIDELSIWSRALSASEVKGIFDLQNGTNAGVGSVLEFTPDVNGTFTINLEVSASSNINADAVITTGGGQKPSFQGDAFQGEDFEGEGFQGD